MMNKKGSSLIELIISIALLAVIVTFMMKMLIDVKNTATNATYSKNNQINRSEIMTFIQEDLRDKEVTKVIDNSSNNKFEIQLDLDTDTGNKTLLYRMYKQNKNYYAYVKNSSGSEKTWMLTNDVEANIDCVLAYNKTISGSSIETFIIDIEIYTANEKNNKEQNNILDDIQISFISSKLTDYKTDLGYKCKR